MEGETLRSTCRAPNRRRFPAPTAGGSAGRRRYEAEPVTRFVENVLPDDLWKTLWTNRRFVSFPPAIKHSETDWRKNRLPQQYLLITESYIEIQAGKRSPLGRGRFRHMVVMRNVQSRDEPRGIEPDREVDPHSSAAREGLRARRRQPARCFRSASITGPVRGARPRQIRNDSAACSTSIPRPSAAATAPSPLPQATNGVGCAA